MLTLNWLVPFCIWLFSRNIRKSTFEGWVEHQIVCSSFGNSFFNTSCAKTCLPRAGTSDLSAFNRAGYADFLLGETPALDALYLLELLVGLLDRLPAIMFPKALDEGHVVPDDLVLFWFQHGVIYHYTTALFNILGEKSQKLIRTCYSSLQPKREPSPNSLIIALANNTGTALKCSTSISTPASINTSYYP